MYALMKMVITPYPNRAEARIGDQIETDACNNVKTVVIVERELLYSRSRSSPSKTN